MKKTRFIPYGYTMRNGRTVIEHGEADIIRYIFDEYIKGASLKDLAEELTARKVPYTEKTEVWDKARIARIIDNAKYTGSEIYDPIIDEDTFEEAAAAKAARLRNQTVSECEGITLMRDRIRCGQCGAPMVRHICSKRKVKESWTCTNDACGCRVRISDTDLLMKVTLLMNRVIENADLMVPKPRKRAKDSPAVQRLQNEIDIELSADQPSEKFIASRICEIASQLYKETNAKEQIAARIAQKRVMLMNPQTEFNSVYFTDLVENVILEAPARVSLLTKTDVQISEGVLNYTNSYARRANMIYTPDTKKAIKLCFEAHRNQTDKSGLPYVFHPFHVAEQMPDEETTIVALLHDVIEDTAYTIDDLRKMGFSEEVLDALDLMTHDKNVPYMEYVAKISENEIARTVKLADLRHNSDLTRLDEIDDKARNRIEKYKAAIRLLSESKTSFCPYYDKGTDTWRVDFPDRDSEEGDLLYVASEYARTGLYYPYNVAVTAGKEYSGHAHSFEGVIQALLDDPAGFSIAGFEEFYSKQEQEMLLDIRNKLMNNIGEKASTAAKPDSSELL